MAMSLKAVRKLRYAGRSMLPGDDFEATEKDGELLVAIGKAEPRKAAYQTRVMTAGDEAAAVPAKKAAAKKAAIVTKEA